MFELQVAIYLDSSLNFKHMRIEGLSSSDYASTDVRNRYKYNGKELFSDLQWLNYGARFYDAAVGRWWVRDPKAEKYYALTPYSYVGGNVVNAVDLWGMAIIIPPTEEEYKQYNVSHQAKERFEKILQNLVLLEQNESFMLAFKYTTGLTDEQIHNFLNYGSGPKVILIPGTDAGANNPNEFRLGVEIINYLGKADNDELYLQSFGVAMVLIDELAHCGDMMFNNTTSSTGQTLDKDDFGKQVWRKSPMLHRGGDPQFYGWGVRVSINTIYTDSPGKINIEPVYKPIIKPLKEPKRANFNIEN